MAETIDLLIGMLDGFRNGAKRRIADLSDEQLAKRPTTGVNSVGFTVWHALRGQDRGFGAMSGQGDAGQIWGTGGFAEQTGYDPRGKGFRGIGIGTGFTRAMVDEAPVGKDLLTAYADALHAAVTGFLKSQPDAQLLAPIPNPTQSPANPSPTTTLAQMALGSLNHGLPHLGEADVLRSLLGIPDPTTPQEE
ncbi:MAG: DinB family protein [Chloroflexi bacterium]|nr:DinB family protein [Chloroflexota bacterium]